MPLANYRQYTTKLLNQGFLRVEHDDRLLDILPTQTRDKGIELWDKWEESNVTIIRLRLPFNPKKRQVFTLSRLKLEQTLSANTLLYLEDFKTI